MRKTHSELIWENVQDPLRRVVRDAWQAEMMKEPAAPDREATRAEMVKWTAIARKRLIAAIDGFLKKDVKEYGR